MKPGPSLVAVALLLGCAFLTPLDGCGAAGCAERSGLSGPGLLGIGVAAIGLLVLVVLGLRDATRCRRRVTSIGIVPSPLIDRASAAIGVARVLCLDTDEGIAVCSGSWSPGIYISRGLAASLPAEELAAVLLHEQAHQRRRDPLRRALRQRLAQALFLIPLVGWWDERTRTAEEIAADAAALRRCGRRSLAGALLIAGRSASLGAAAAFDGSAALRIRKLAGDSVSLGAPPLRLCSQSALGAAIIAAALTCIAGLPWGL